MENCTHVEWFASIEDLVRVQAREFVESLIEDEVTQALERIPYGRGGCGYRNGRRERTLQTATGPLELSVARARIWEPDGSEREFQSKWLPKGARLTRNAQALITATYLCGVSTRRVSVALAHALGSGVSRSTVSRCVERLRPGWESWRRRDLSEDRIVRLMLDGLTITVRMDGTAHKLSVLVALGIRSDGQKVLLAMNDMGGESKAAWRALLDDLASRGVSEPQLVVTDGSKGLEAALAELWPNSLVQRCTVHKERNLLSCAPDSMHEELKHDYHRMIQASCVEEAVASRKAFLSKWRSKCPKVASSLEEAGDRLFTFLRLPAAQWKCFRSTNVIERLNEEFRRRIKVQGALPGGESACMLFWALLACGAVQLKRVQGFETLGQAPSQAVDLAA